MLPAEAGKASELRLVVLDIERPRPVEIDAGTRSNAAHGHQPERGRF